MSELNENNFTGLDELKNEHYFDFTKTFESPAFEDFDNPYENISLNCDYLDSTEFLNKYRDSKEYSLLTWNIQGLNSKFNELKEFFNILHSNDFTVDILALQETHQIVNRDLFNLPNFKPLISKDRTSNRWGGIGFFINQDLKYKILDDLSIFKEGIIETLFIEVEFAKNVKYTIGNCYRPPSKGLNNLSPKQQTELFLDELLGIMDKISHSKRKCKIVGDFNLNLLQYESCALTEKFVDIMFSSAFLQLVSHPTRIAHHNNKSSVTLIDHIWSNEIHRSISSGIITTHISDHFPTFTFFKNQTKNKAPTKFVTSRNFSEANIQKFKDSLQNSSFNEVISLHNPQESYDKFHTLFHDLYEENFPLKTIRFNRNIHNIERWMTPELLNSRSIKFELEKKYINNPSEENLHAYKSHKNRYNQQLRKSKKDHYSQLLNNCQGDLKKSWQLMKEAAVHGDKNIASQFNMHFVSAASKVKESIPPSNKDPSDYLNDYDLNFDFIDVTPDLICTSIKELKDKKSADFTGLSSFIVKKFQSHLLISSIDHLGKALSHLNSRLQKFVQFSKKGGWKLMSTAIDP